MTEQRGTAADTQERKMSFGQVLAPGLPTLARAVAAGVAAGALTLIPVGRLPLERAALGGAALGAVGLCALGIITDARRAQQDSVEAPGEESGEGSSGQAPQRGLVATCIRAAGVGALIGGIVTTAIVLPDRLMEKAVSRAGVRRPRLVMAGAAAVLSAVEEITDSEDVSSDSTGTSSVPEDASSVQP